MAILHTITIDKPEGISPFPPSVANSDWFNNFIKYLKDHDIQDFGNTSTWCVISPGGHYSVLFFENRASYDTWKTFHTLTDPVLMSDVDTWKAAHGITFTHQVYTISDPEVVSAFI